MTHIKQTLAFLLVSICTVAFAHADEVEFTEFGAGNMYAGGGLSYNSLSRNRFGSSFDDAVGLQGFAGWNFLRFRALTVAGEVGVFTSGSFSHDHESVNSISYEGIYANAVAKYPLTDTIWVQGRVGPNVSDTGAEMIGGGFGFRLSPAFSVRAEAARYGNVTSLIRVDAVFEF